jgi:hypothetical protein
LVIGNVVGPRQNAGKDATDIDSHPLLVMVEREIP